MIEVLVRTKEKAQINLSLNLKRYRETRGWDQNDLAATAGLEQPTIACYEQMTRFPRIFELGCLARACGTTPGRLLEDPAFVPEEKLKELLRVLSTLDNSQTESILAYAKALASGSAPASPGPPPSMKGNEAGKKSKNVSS